MQRNDQLDEWDRGTFFHPSTHLAQFARGDMPNRIVTGGKGVYIEDHNGNKLLDGFAGLYCVNVGYGRSEVADAIADRGRAANVDLVVAVGGGSVIDTSKLVCTLLTEGGRAVDRVGIGILTRPQTPLIVVPTTAGTGSAVE